jgi:hypothetical protein
MNHIEKRLEAYKSGIALIEAFNHNYSIDLPENIISVWLGFQIPTVAIHCGLAPNEHGRAKVLCAIGDALGREGWTKEEDSMRSSTFKWKREIDGVRVEIESAEPIPERKTGIPVPPSAFPILIKDVEAA